MEVIRVVDARMGRGKSTAAINYINAHKKSRRFMYVTPFLREVARIRDECGLEEPVADDDHSKLFELRGLLHAGKSISTTHSLYQLIDDDMLDMISEKKYTLIIDETITAIQKIQITSHDRQILDGMTSVDDSGLVSWVDPEYTGKLGVYKDLADSHTLYQVDSSFIGTFNHHLLTSFDDVFLLTYLFRGSTLEAYLNSFGLKYEIWGVGRVDGKPSFVFHEDIPEPIDFRGLITIVDKKSMNEIGDPYHALAKNWYVRRTHHDQDMIQLRRNMQNFFKNVAKGPADSRLWTCFKDQKQKLVPDDGSYAHNFLQMQARATNDFASCTNLAYMVNRFQDPNLVKFFADRGYKIDQDKCALSDMLQWIWRSAVRNGKPINLYIPSRRMRELLTGWMNNVAEGGVVYEHLE